MEIVFFWIVFAVIVGVGANTRGRDPVGWVLLAIVISPVLAGLLLLALPRRAGPIAAVAAPPGPVPDVFEPESVYGGVPYRTSPDGSIDALMQGARVRFASADAFKRLVDGNE